MTHRRANERFILLTRTALIAVLWLLVSCEEQVVFHQYVPIAEAQWHQLDTISFTPQVPDSGTSYQASIEIRLLQSYPYQDLIVGYEFFSPEHELLQSGTFEFNTTDSYYDKNGSGLAGLHSYSAYVKSLPVEKAGDYSIRIFQLEKDTLLRGVQDIGIKLSRH